MKTQLLVTVKDASIFTKSQSHLLWFIHIFKKASINVYIDSMDASPITLTARPQPYELELSPGKHTIFFVDPTAKFKATMNSFSRKITLGAFGAGMGLAAGGLSGATIFASSFAGGKRKETRNDVLECVLEDGDELAVTVKPLYRKVKIVVDC